MADRVQWHQELTYRTGGNDTFAVVEDTPKCDPNPRPQCDHICLGEYGHDGPHFYGYRSGTPVDEINRLIDEIERLRKRDAVLELFAKAFHVDEYGQFPVTNGEDVWAAVLAYAQMKVEEARHG